MGQGLDVAAACHGTCHFEDEGRKKDKSSASSWSEETVIGCHVFENGFKNSIAVASRGSAEVSESVLANHELLQHSREGNLKGLSEALDKGAWTETRRPLVMKPQKPEDEDMPGAGGGRISQAPPQDVGMTALMFSAQAGSLECVRKLLWAGALVNAMEEDGWTPLHFAAKEEHFEVCAALLQSKANPNAKNCDDATPLELAAMSDQAAPGDFPERFRALIQRKGSSPVAVK